MIIFLKMSDSDQVTCPRSHDSLVVGWDVDPGLSPSKVASPPRAQAASPRASVRETRENGVKALCKWLRATQMSALLIHQGTWLFLQAPT